MKKDLSLFSLCIGIILYVIQLLVTSFDYLDGSYYLTEQFAVVNTVTFESFMSFAWAAILGTIMLVASFFLRFIHRSAFVFEFAGFALWLFQIYRIYDIVNDFTMLASKSFLGIIGAVLVAITLIYDICMIIRKREERSVL